MALGLYYYRCFRDYDRALAEIAVAGRDRPNDVDVISWKATLNKRQGNLDEAIRLNNLALEIDPMDHTAAQELSTRPRSRLTSGPSRYRPTCPVRTISRSGSTWSGKAT